MQILKTTYVDIRATYVAHTFLPFVHNFSPYVEQLPKYRSLHKAVLGSVQSYIALPADQYRFILLPFRWCYFIVGHSLRLCYVGAAKCCHIAEKKSALLAECEVL